MCVQFHNQTSKIPISDICFYFKTNIMRRIFYHIVYHPTTNLFFEFIFIIEMKLVSITSISQLAFLSDIVIMKTEKGGIVWRLHPLLYV